MHPLIEFEVPIYQYQIALFLLPSEIPEQFKKHGDGSWCTSNKEGSVLHVPMTDGRLTARFVHLLSHELNHAAMDLLRTRGITFGPAHQESLCYIQGYMLETVLDKLMIQIK